jgi:hypothetical protein
MPTLARPPGPSPPQVLPACGSLAVVAVTRPVEAVLVRVLVLEVALVLEVVRVRVWVLVLVLVQAPRWLAVEPHLEPQSGCPVD